MNAAYLNTVLKMAEDALLKPPLAPEEDGDEINQRRGTYVEFARIENKTTGRD
jgi:hypothetical protein